MPREGGEALLAALRGNLTVPPPWPENVMCVLYPPASVWVRVKPPEGEAFEMGFTPDCGLAYLPKGMYVVSEAARGKVKGILKGVTEAERRRITSARRPVVYTVGSLDDGGTLSGIARMFYGDGGQYRKIFAANRGVLKDPDVIRDGMKLTIPK